MNLVEVRNNQVVVSSKKVADRFNKLHKDVLENIRNILAAENSATKFFQESTFENRGKQYPEYLMNRDGFTLLAMGFTGKEAFGKTLDFMSHINYNKCTAKSEVKNMSPRTGRPKLENPNSIKLSTRINAELNSRLEHYCYNNNVSKGEVIRQGIEKVLSENEK